MILDVRPLSQRDPRWRDLKLGTSEVTIGDYGCLLVCTAMLAEYYGHPVSVPELNQRYAAQQAFEQGSLYRWYQGLPVAFPDIRLIRLENTPEPLTPSQFADIDRQLRAGHPVIVQVDFRPEDAPVQPHYVVIIGEHFGQYLVADPWYGDVASLTRYGEPRITIQQMAFHEGPLPEPASTPTQPPLRERVIDWDDPEGQRRNVEWYVASWWERTQEAARLRQELDRLESEHSAWQEEAQRREAGLRSQVEALTRQLQELSERPADLSTVGWATLLLELVRRVLPFLRRRG